MKKLSLLLFLAIPGFASAEPVSVFVDTVSISFPIEVVDTSTFTVTISTDTSASDETEATVEELKKEILLLLQRVSILEIDTKKQ